MNKKKNLIISLLVFSVISVGLVFALKPIFVPSRNAGKSGRVVEMPSHAVEVAPGVYYLGEAMDNGRVVEGYAFVKYKKGYGKPSGCNDDGVCQGWEDASSCADCSGGGGGDDGDTGGSSCYEFLARGVKWKRAEPWVANMGNEEGLDAINLFGNLEYDISKWEDAADGTVDGSITKDILGDGTRTEDELVADTESPDDKNEVYFGDVGQEGAIAVTIVWYYSRGPPQSRELVEWDMIFDQVDFDWSVSEETGKMDFENIATHELGHSVGLGDLYTSECSEQTMYGYASNRETKKRDLEAGDITGVQELYK